MGFFRIQPSAMLLFGFAHRAVVVVPRIALDVRAWGAEPISLVQR